MKEFNVEISRSLNKKFKSKLLAKFLKAIDEYKLIQPNDKICVAMSGGKDSLVLAMLFEEYRRHYQNDIEIVYLMMNSGFKDEFIENHFKLLDKIGIDQTTISSKVYEVANEMNPKAPCFLCARMRRGFLYSKAQELGCNKLALGHHFDDVIETTLMNMFYTGTFKTMLPKVKSKNYEGLELIRPMYLIKEEDVKKLMAYHELHVSHKGCLFQERQINTKRDEMKKLVSDLRNVYENIDINIFRSAENINLDSTLGYIKDDIKHNYLEAYDEE
ncbi:tRNA 2-thiocytidine biosynthesis protein TtcA [Mycoplasmatota bacterium]|nr:tRNA 2-thiocytidine biosynthesis protein TtcA [Mycoplasmatota bacterium]